MTDQEQRLKCFYFRWIKRSLILFFLGALIAMMPRSFLERYIAETFVAWVWFSGLLVAFVGCIDYTGLIFQRKKVWASFEVAEKFNLKPIHPTLHLLRHWRSLKR